MKKKVRSMLDSLLPGIFGFREEVPATGQFLLPGKNEAGTRAHILTARTSGCGGPDVLL